MLSGTIFTRLQNFTIRSCRGLWTVRMTSRSSSAARQSGLSNTTLALDRWVPKWTSFLYAIFGLPSAQPLRLALVDSTDRYLRAWKPVPSCLQFDQQRVLSRFFLPSFPSFSLFQRPPSPSWRNEKLRLRSWELEPKPTAIREGRTERRTALSTTGNTIRRLRGVKIRY